MKSFTLTEIEKNFLHGSIGNFPLPFFIYFLSTVENDTVLSFEDNSITNDRNFQINGRKNKINPTVLSFLQTI